MPTPPGARRARVNVSLGPFALLGSAYRVAVHKEPFGGLAGTGASARPGRVTSLVLILCKCSREPIKRAKFALGESWTDRTKSPRSSSRPSTKFVRIFGRNLGKRIGYLLSPGADTVGPGSMKTPVLGPRRALAFLTCVTDAVPIVSQSAGGNNNAKLRGTLVLNHPSNNSSQSHFPEAGCGSALALTGQHATVGRWCLKTGRSCGLRRHSGVAVWNNPGGREDRSTNFA